MGRWKQDIWSEAEVEFLSNNYDKMTAKEIGEHIGIICKRQKMNLPTKTDDYQGKDGQFYDSKQEKDVADLLYSANIKYQRGHKTWFKPDFIVGNVVVSILGFLADTQNMI